MYVKSENNKTYTKKVVKIDAISVISDFDEI